MSSTWPSPARSSQDVADRVEVIQRLQGHLGFRDVLIELAIDAETPHFSQPVTVGIEKFFPEQFLGLLELRGVARTQALVNPQ